MLASHRTNKHHLRRLQNGDAAAWGAFVDEYGTRVYALARRFTPTDADAEDLTQEIWMQVSGSLNGFRGDCALSTWIYRIAWNRACRWQKMHAGENLAPLEDDTMSRREATNDDPAYHAMNGELSDEITQALGALSEPHRSVVILHEMHGLTYAECAQVMDVPIGTVKSRLSNAFGRLRTLLRPYVEDEPLPTPLRSEAIGGNA